MALWQHGSFDIKQKLAYNKASFTFLSNQGQMVTENEKRSSEDTQYE